MKEPIKQDKEYYNLLNKITSGCLFKYFSYDHKKALEEFNINNKYAKEVLFWKSINQNIPCYEMPEELKEKYKVERIGKLRSIEFSPNGKAWRIKIGNKYSKSYSLGDFGNIVFII